MIAHKRLHQVAFGRVNFDFYNVVAVTFNDAFASMDNGAIIATTNVCDCREFIAFGIFDVSVEHF